MACSQAADRDFVCTTSNISTYTIRELLGLPRRSSKSLLWLVPVFQRRYCWGPEQFELLVTDAIKQCSKFTSYDVNGRQGHALGRMVVHTHDSGDFLLIDGQQRLTTFCLLLSSVRDFLLDHASLHDISDSHRKQLVELADDFHNALFSSTNRCVLLPSYFDRVSFSMCVNYEGRDESQFKKLLAEYSKVGDETFEDDHILQARSFFDGALYEGDLCETIAGKLDCDGDTQPSSGSVTNSRRLKTDCATVLLACTSLRTALLDSFTALFFETNEQDVQSVYERLAMREKMLSAMHNRAPGVNMAESDLVRNLVTSYGVDDDAQIALYTKYWSPVEKLAMTAATREPSATAATPSTAVVLNPNSTLDKTVAGKLNEVLMHYMDTHNEPSMSFNAESKAEGPSSSEWTELKEHNSSKGCVDDDEDEDYRRPPLPAQLSMGPPQRVAPTFTSKPQQVPTGIPKMWTDPGQQFFPMYSKMKSLVHNTLENAGLPILMQAPTAQGEKAISTLLHDILAHATNYWAGDGTHTHTSSVNGNSTSKSSLKMSKLSSKFLGHRPSEVFDEGDEEECGH